VSQYCTLATDQKTLGESLEPVPRSTMDLHFSRII